MGLANRDKDPAHPRGCPHTVAKKETAPRATQGWKKENPLTKRARMLRLIYRVAKPVMLFSTGANSSAEPRHRPARAPVSRLNVSVDLLPSPSTSTASAAR